MATTQKKKGGSRAASSGGRRTASSSSSSRSRSSTSGSRKKQPPQPAHQPFRREIGAAIDTVPDARLQELLRLRYIEGMTWERVAVQIDYSYMQVCRLHGKALSQLKM